MCVVHTGQIYFLYIYLESINNSQNIAAASRFTHMTHCFKKIKKPHTWFEKKNGFLREIPFASADLAHAAKSSCDGVLSNNWNTLLRQ